MSFSFIRQHETNLLQGWKEEMVPQAPNGCYCVTSETPQTGPAGSPIWVWVQWETLPLGSGGWGLGTGMGGATLRPVASSFRYLEMTMVSQQKSSRS